MNGVRRYFSLRKKSFKPANQLHELLARRCLRRREDVVIDNIESIRDSDLDMYSILKPQGIESLIVVPLVLNDVISGFIGVDNPKANRDDHSLLHSLAYFVTNEQRKRNMQSELKRMSYCDDLTGLLAKPIFPYCGSSKKIPRIRSASLLWISMG